MTRSFPTPLAVLAALALSGCWWNADVPIQDSWHDDEDDGYGEPGQGDTEETGEPSEFFSPNWWTLELWGLYDGQRLTDFRYHSAASGAVPAFAILRFIDPQWTDDEEECYWVGSVVVQGWTVLTDDQYAAWGFTLEGVDTNCTDFDREVWYDRSPATIIESLYWTMAYRPPTPELASELDHDDDGPLSWASKEDDKALSLQLGVEQELGVWEHEAVGAAYVLKTVNEDTVSWDFWGYPYVIASDEEGLEGHVIVAGSLGRLKLGMMGVE